MLPLKTAVSMPPPPVSVSWPDPPWIVSAKTEPMTSSLPLSASIREMATSRVALKSRKLLVAVPATMLLPPRPSIDRLADRQPAHVDPVVAVAADHAVMAIAAIEQVVAVGGTRDGEGIMAGAAEELTNNGRASSKERVRNYL